MPSHTKIYPIHKHPNLADLQTSFTHSCNPDFVEKIVFKFNLSSEYPHYLVKLDLANSSKIVKINGTDVHLILQYSVKNDAYGLWTFPDQEEYIARYEKIFSTLVDILSKNIK